MAGANGSLLTKAHTAWRAAARLASAAIAPAATAPNEPGNAMSGAFADVRQHIVLAIVFSAAINLLYLTPSLYMLQVYDRVLVSGGLLTLAFLSAAALVALVVLAMLDALRTRVLARLSVSLDAKLAQPVMRANFSARAGTSEGGNFSGVRDLDTLRQGITSPGVIALMDVPWTPLFILACFAVHIAVGATATIGAIIIFGVALLNERASRASIAAVAKSAPGYYGGLEADLRMAETARAMGMEDRLIARRVADRGALIDAQTDAAFVGAHFGSLAKFVRLVLQSAVLGLGAYLAVLQEISGGAIIAATILTARAFAPIEQVVGGWRQTTQTWIAYKALRGEIESVGTERAGRTALPTPKGQIDVEGVWVRRPGVEKPALANVSFSVPPGQIVGVIGPSGAGKSTLVRIIANAAPPTAGGVRLDRARYENWLPEQLAPAIGYLPQSVDLLSGTIAENISRFAQAEEMSAEEISRKVVSAAIAAGAHEMILGLPQAYETKIGPSGKGLSHGQAQRVGIARALYGEPVLLVMDEPNAHLDDDGEGALIAALREAKARGATSFIVAHRARLIGVADLLLVLRDGVALEFGPRDAVAAKLAAAAPRPMTPRLPKLDKVAE